MGRPIKDNADYFTHDADMRDDPKIKALRRKYNVAGYGVWCMLLEAITDSDNFILKLDLEIVAGDFGIEPDYLTEVVEYCVKLGLLNWDKQSNTVWSKTMNERFSGLLSKRKRERGEFPSAKTPEPKVSVNGSAQSRVEESKAENSRALIAPEVFETKAEAHKFLTTNLQDLSAAKTVLSNLGWSSVNDVDVGALAFHFCEQKLDILLKPKQEVRQHFQNWLNKIPIGDLQKTSIQIIARHERKQQTQIS